MKEDISDKDKYFILRNKKTNWIDYDHNDYRVILYFSNTLKIYKFNLDAFYLWTLFDGDSTWSQIKNSYLKKYNKINSSEFKAFIKYLENEQLINLNNKAEGHLFLRKLYHFKNKTHLNGKISVVKLIEKYYHNHSFLQFLDKQTYQLIFNKNTQNKLFIPESVELDITYECNLNCEYCYIKEKNVKIEKRIYEIIKEVAKANIQKISFLGGEPFTSSELIDYIKYAGSFGLTITVFTNGTYDITPYLKELKDLNVRLSISFNPNDPSENIRNRINNIKKAVSYKIPISLSYLITKESLFFVLKAYLLARKLGVIRFYVRECIATNNTMISIKINFIERILLTFFSECMRFITQNSKTKYKIPKPNINKVCLTAYTLSLKPNGDVIYCPKASKSFILGNVFKKEILNLWNSRALNRHYDKNKIKEPCKSCIFRNKCFMGCRAELFNLTNNIHAGSYLCFRGKISLVFNNILHFFKK